MLNAEAFSERSNAHNIRDNITYMVLASINASATSCTQHRQRQQRKPDQKRQTILTLLLRVHTQLMVNGKW